MKTVKDLVGTYIICYNQEDWEKVILILRSYFPYMQNDSVYYIWFKNSKFQYVNIENEKGIGYDNDKANNIQIFTKNLKEILLEDFLKYF